MDELSSELAALLVELDVSPHQGALRLRAAVVANRLASVRRDPFAADVAETLAEEVAPGATRALRAALAEQAALARQLRRLSGGGASPAGAGVAALAPARVSA